MATLLLDRAQLEVRVDGESLALYEAGERRGQVPIKLIDRCIVHGAQTRLDSGVLLKLAEAGVPVVLFSPRIGRRVALLLGPRHNDAAPRLAQALRVTDEAWSLAWARELVRAKLRRQHRLILAWMAARPDARKPLFDAAQTVDDLLGLLDQAENADALRGMEGLAARASFEALAAVVPPELGFAGRNRRPPRDPVNVTLSLGYSLLHVEAVQALHIAGLDPLLGFYHRPAFGRESLACDLIEPLRPAVDRWVWECLRSRRLRLEHFSKDRGACLLGKAGRAAFYAEWASDGVKPLRRILRLQARRLARTLHQDGLPWVQADPDDDEMLAA